MPDSHDNVVLIAPQLAFHEVTGVQLLGTDGWNDPSLVDIGERHVEGAVFSAVYHRELPHAFFYDFARGYEEAFGDPPAAFGRSLHPARRKCGATSPSALGTEEPDRRRRLSRRHGHCRRSRARLTVSS